MRSRQSDVGVLFGVLFLVAAVAACAGWMRPAPHATRALQPVVGETVYIRNVARQYITDRQIADAIPAWQAAANVDFAGWWHTAHVRLIFIGRRAAPRGGVVATFVPKGDVKGALAYHTVDRGAPSITVYAGTGDYYGYSNSVSFTHELFELLADPEISIANQGWPYGTVTLLPSHEQLPQTPGTIWINEVSDPVEAYHYVRSGGHGAKVWISDFVTPNWFNDEVNGSYDFMQIVQQPFTIARGGYAQYWDAFLGWQAVLNFRHAGRDADGFFKGEGEQVSH